MNAPKVPLERALAHRPGWRRVARGGWGLLLIFSVAFNLLASVERCAEACASLGIALQTAGQSQATIRQYDQALRLKPAFVEAHNALGLALGQADQPQEARGHFEQALRLRPDFEPARINLARLQAKP